MELVLNKNILEYSYTHIHTEREKQADKNH